MTKPPSPTDPRTRAAPRGETPPVNLKERIAALQQRSVSPNTHQSAQAAPRGLPSPGSGGLRDKIAKFEEKGGVPVPRGSFAMGAPQLAENAPSKKRGELYGNRLTGLGRPSGAPVGSRSGSPLPSTDDSPGPRKRCISAGTALSSAPSSNFSTNEPVPALPNTLPGVTPRRNSLAVNFGSGRRVMSASDGEGQVGEFVDASMPSLASLVPEKPPDIADTQPPIPESMEEPTPQPSSPEVVLESLEPPPVAEETLPANPDTAEVDTPAGEPPAPQNHSPPPLYDVSENVSQSPSIAQSSKDGLSDYESAPQSAISQPSPSLPLPEPVPPVPFPVPTDAPSVVPNSPPRTETVVISLSPPPKKATKQVAASQDSAIAVPAPNPTPPSVPTPNPTTESRSRSKSTFKAVVHRKVTEPTGTPAASTLAPPATPQLIKQRRGVNDIKVVEVPSSPGVGDLALLLEDAAMLELRLTEGDGTGSKTRELLDRTPTSATFQPDPRQASASTLTEHAYMPSDDSGSQSVRSMSIPSIREPLVDSDIPEGDETDGRSLASTTFSQRSPSHRKYLSNIYRLTSRRSSSYMPGTYPRDSMSMSSEDSSPVTTPSDNGKRKGFGIAWPSASPKKGSPNVSRSTSFADKIFNRNRTKSNVSTADQGTSHDASHARS